MSKYKNTIAIFVAILAAMGGYGFASVMLNNLLTPMWFPALFAFLLALLSYIIMPGIVRVVTESSNRWINGIVHTAVFTGVFLSLITALNTIGEDSRPCHTVEAQIIRTYYTTHHTTKRLRRNTYVKGLPYHEYHAELHFPNGKQKTVTVSRATYTKLSRKHWVEVNLISGVLGMEIIKGL